jgi:hypothetical protein
MLLNEDLDGSFYVPLKGVARRAFADGIGRHDQIE